MIGKKTSLTELLYDAQTRSYVFQGLLLFGLVFGAWWLVDNTLTNLEAQGKTLGFSFLSQNAGFQISSTLGTWVMGYTVGSSSYFDVYLIGIINTFLVAFWVLSQQPFLASLSALCVCHQIW